MPTSDTVARLRPASVFHTERSSFQSYWSRWCVMRTRSPVLWSNHSVFLRPTGGVTSSPCSVRPARNELAPGTTFAVLSRAHCSVANHRSARIASRSLPSTGFTFLDV
jgi:hypothetical protein